MEEIKIGEYIRTHTGMIAKVINDNYFMPIYIECNEGIFLRENITKHSPNIIDLVEVGDYVNHQQVLIIKDGIPYVEYSNEFDDYIGYITNDIIKCIVTKEQFEAIKYEVI